MRSPVHFHLRLRAATRWCGLAAVRREAPGVSPSAAICAARRKPASRSANSAAAIWSSTAARRAWMAWGENGSVPLQESPHRRSNKVEDDGRHHRRDELQHIHWTEFAARNAGFQSRLHAQRQWAAVLLHDARQVGRHATSCAHHFALEEPGIVRALPQWCRNGRGRS